MANTYAIILAVVVLLGLTLTALFIIGGTRMTDEERRLDDEEQVRALKEREERRGRKK